MSLPLAGAGLASLGGAGGAAGGLAGGGGLSSILPKILEILKGSSVNVAGKGFNVGINNRQRGGGDLAAILEQLRQQRGGGGAPAPGPDPLPVRNVGTGGGGGAPLTFDSLLRPGATFVDSRRRFDLDQQPSLSLRR